MGIVYKISNPFNNKVYIKYLKIMVVSRRTINKTYSFFNVQILPL